MQYKTEGRHQSIDGVHPEFKHSGIMKWVAFISFSLLSILNLNAQLSVDQTLSTCYGQTAFGLAKSRGLYQNTMVVGNHFQYGIGRSTSIGLGIVPLGFGEGTKPLGLGVFHTLNISQVLYESKTEAIKIGAFGATDYLPIWYPYPGLVGGYLLYSRKFNDFNMATVGYSFMGSYIYIPWSNLVSFNYKKSLPTKQIGVEIGGVIRWSGVYDDNPDWGWADRNFRLSLLVSKKLRKNNSLFFGVTGWAHYEWDPRNYGWFFPAAWPVIGYTKHL